MSLMGVAESGHELHVGAPPAPDPLGSDVHDDAESNPRRTRRSPPAWALFLIVVALPLVAVYRFVPGFLVHALVYDGMALACVVAILVGIRRNRPASTLPWYLLAAGVTLWLAGDLTYSVYEHLIGSTPYPSISDAMYLPSYPLMAAGVYLLVRGHAKRDRSLFIDASIITIGVAVLGWLTLMAPYLHDQSLGTAQKIVAMAYPLGDLLIFAILLRFLLGSRSRSMAHLLIATGLGLTIVSDSFYGFLAISGGYYSGHLVDYGWLLFYACWGAAALHPSMAKASTEEPVPDGRMSGWHLFLMVVSAVLVPAVALFQLTSERLVDLIVIAAASMVMFLLVVLRMRNVLRRLESAHGSLRIAQDEKERLLDRTMQIGELERSRIAAELHDGPIQQLSALGYRFEAGLVQLEEGAHDEAAATLSTVRDAFGKEIATLRHVMSGLRPPSLDERGLETALRDHLDAFSDASGIETTFDVELSKRLSRDVETSLFRVTQEALINCAKHSGAAGVDVRLRGDGDWADLRIVDHGTGFDPTGGAAGLPGHFGLDAMRQRMEMVGGTFQISSHPSRGTTIHARLGAPS